ncbi:MAG TPA: NAD(+) kinase [Gammaproteobacteria bacterium]|nr:NAD(+) kinase [Gammaproteobacteria bacterium]
MSQSFSSVGILGREDDSQVARTVATLVGQLRAAGVQVLLDAALPPLPETESLARDAVCRRADLVVVVGGDGTLLKAAHTVATHPVPLVGINLGRLGFLADIPPDSMADDLRAILAGDYQEEERLLLNADLIQGEHSSACAPALNDVVVQKADGGRLIEFETHVDGHFVCAHRADGIIIATPTGSTAYALSGGGSILHPALDAVTLVPICPHALGDRPIVVNGNSRIEIVLNSTHGGRAQVTCDGQHSQPLAAGDRVRVQRAARGIRFIHPHGHDYYRILRTKLHWGQNARPPRKD